MTDETPPCGFCRKLPKRAGQLIACGTIDCPNWAIDVPYIVWCFRQPLILAARKLDFEAGRDSHLNGAGYLFEDFEDYMSELERGGE